MLGGPAALEKPQRGCSCRPNQDHYQMQSPAWILLSPAICHNIMDGEHQPYYTLFYSELPLILIRVHVTAY